MFEKKMHLDLKLTWAGRTGNNESMNVVVFSHINFELTLCLIKKRYTHENTSY